MKLLWTKDPKPPAPRRERQAPQDHEDVPGPRRLALERPPDALRLVPFHLATCTLAEPVPEADQAAFTAHNRAHATRAGFWEHAPSADWMLDLLRQSWHFVPVAPDALLRTFALKCVADLEGANSSTLAELTSLVQRRISGTVTASELAAEQARTRPFVTAAGVQELPRCRPYGAGKIARWHTANPNPYEAAFRTAEFAALHDAFAALARAARSWTAPPDTPVSWRVSVYAQQHPDVRHRALRQAHERQAGLLKSILAQPFAAVDTCGRLH